MIRRVAFIFLIFFTWGRSMAGDNDVRIGATFPAEAKARWREYVRRVTRYEAAGRSQLTNVVTGEVRMTGRGTGAISGTWALASGFRSSQPGQASSHREVRGINSTYSFHLVRDTEDADWRGERLEWIAPDAAADGLQALALPPENPIPSVAENQTVWHARVRSVGKALMLNNLWFPSMIESPDFALRSVENVESEGRVLVRVEFVYLPDEALRTPVRGGFVILDPERYWLIREARTEADWGEGSIGEIHIDNEFDTSLEALPLLAHHQMHWIATTDEGEPVHNVSEMWFDRWKRSSGEENDYRLSAFGLPEPQPPRRRTRRWIWFAVHAVVGGFLMLWYGVRRLGTGRRAG